MKKTFKILSIVLCIILCSASLFSAPVFASSAKKVSLSTTKKTITLGSTFTLKLKNNKNKVTWAVINGKNRVKLSSKTKTSVKILPLRQELQKCRQKLGVRDTFVL